MRTLFTLSRVFAQAGVQGDDVVMTATRRAQNRIATTAEIKRAALEEIARAGAPALSLRAVARAIGMSPAGLYRYYDGRDELLTALITDAYNDLADAVEAAIADAEGALAQFRAGVQAYRSWALAQPNRFLLIFGTPIPGYAAPEDGPTVAANRRIGAAFFGVAGEALRAGHTFTATREATIGEAALAGEFSDEMAGFPPEIVGALLGTWAHWHGLVSLEVTHQFDWIYPDDVERFFEGEIERMIASLGWGE